MSGLHIDIQNTLEACEALLAQGQTQKALKKLLTLEEKKFRFKFVPLSNQYEILERQFHKGMVTSEEFCTKMVRLNSAILRNMEEVEDALNRKPFDGTIATKKNALKWSIGVGASVILGIIVYIVFMHKVSGSKNGDFKVSTPKKCEPTLIEGTKWLICNLDEEVEDSWCFDENSLNGEKYGRLYTFNSAQIACRKLGPGCRLPSDAEWQSFATYYGGYRKGEREDIGYPRETYDALKSAFKIPIGGMRNSEENFVNLERLSAYWASPQETKESPVYYMFTEEIKDSKKGVVRNGFPIKIVVLERFELDETYQGSEKYAFSCFCVQD